MRLGAHRYAFSLLEALLPGSQLPVFLVHCPEAFDRPTLYTDGPDEHLRFLVLQRAVLESCQRMGFAPHIVHCNDWHTGAGAGDAQIAVRVGSPVCEHAHASCRFTTSAIRACSAPARPSMSAAKSADLLSARRPRQGPDQLAARRRAARASRHHREPDLRAGNLHTRSADMASMPCCANAPMAWSAF